MLEQDPPPKSSPCRCNRRSEPPTREMPGRGQRAGDRDDDLGADRETEITEHHHDKKPRVAETVDQVEEELREMLQEWSSASPECCRPGGRSLRISLKSRRPCSDATRRVPAGGRPARAHSRLRRRLRPARRSP